MANVSGKNQVLAIDGVDLAPFVTSVQVSADGEAWEDAAEIAAPVSGTLSIEGLWNPSMFSLDVLRESVLTMKGQPDMHVIAFDRFLTDQREALRADTHRAIRECFPERAEQMIAGLEALWPK